METLKQFQSLAAHSNWSLHKAESLVLAELLPSTVHCLVPCQWTLTACHENDPKIVLEWWLKCGSLTVPVIQIKYSWSHELLTVVISTEPNTRWPFGLSA